MLIGGFVLGLVTMLVSDAARGSRPALMLLPCILAVDLGVWGYSYVFAGGVDTVAAVAASADAPPAAAGSTVHQSVRKQKLNLALMRDLRMLHPAVGLPPTRRLTLANDDELRASGAEWVADERGWRRVEDPMPRVRFAPDWRVVEDPADLSGIDIRRTALVTEAPRAQRDAEATATLVTDDPGRIVVQISAKSDALLVTTEAYDEGWRADGPSGTRLHTLRAYGDYLAVVAPAGDYQVSLSFDPPSMRQGILVSISGLLMVGLLAAFVSWKR